MREIKFRVWDTEERRMGDLLTDYNCVWVRNVLRGDVNGIAIMQYTGLKDKNGKEIYEGDVLSISPPLIPPAICVVEWDDVSSRWNTRNLFQEHQSPYYPLGSWACTGLHSLSVIGNQYQNPELLKGELNGK